MIQYSDFERAIGLLEEQGRAITPYHVAEVLGVKRVEVLPFFGKTTEPAKEAVATPENSGVEELKEEGRRLVKYFRVKFLVYYQTPYYPRGITQKQRGQVQNLLRKLAVDGIAWKAYVDWAFRHKAKGLSGFLSLGFLASSLVVSEYIYFTKKHSSALSWSDVNKLG